MALRVEGDSRLGLLDCAHAGVADDRGGLVRFGHDPSIDPSRHPHDGIRRCVIRRDSVTEPRPRDCMGKRQARVQ